MGHLLKYLILILCSAIFGVHSLVVTTTNQGLNISTQFIDTRSELNVESLEKNKCVLNGNFKFSKKQYLDFNVTNKIFRSDVLVCDVVYQIKISRISISSSAEPIDYVLTSLIDGSSRGVFLNVDSEESSCVVGVFGGKVGDTSERSINWTIQRAQDDFSSKNITFQLSYKFKGATSIFQESVVLPVIKDCQLHLINEEAIISSQDFPKNNECVVWFPNRENHGLIIELTKLNVPCAKGFIHFTHLNMTASFHHTRNHKSSRLCGKLEELPESDRRIYFPASRTSPLMRLVQMPIFSFSYHLVDYCYNVSFLTKNGSFELKSTGELSCTFKIYLPFGNRIALMLEVGDMTSTGTPTIDFESGNPSNVIDHACDGLETRLYDSDNDEWSHCARVGETQRRIEILSRSNKVVLQVTVKKKHVGTLRMHLTYRAEPIEEIVALCDFGWVAVRQFCIAAFETSKLPWQLAEKECAAKGGHLASIRTEHAQSVLDNLLLNSPGYREHNSYWIGASDKTYEGDFRWSDGLPFSYTNWFPGWTQHGHYNKQPNDDGLSDQDCVEVRRMYSLPTSAIGVASNFMWNDRDCSTSNYFICEKLQNDEPLEETWPLDCNKTVTLTRQQSRSLVSSPGFPRQYPDNVDCTTDIVAPSGYRILLDFEELVLENEPTCSYDFLEIMEGQLNSLGIKNFTTARRLCGDWSSKLKLLRYVSSTSRLRLKFSSDYSHHFGGYKARVTMKNVNQCADDRHHIFNNSCYLFNSYPEVSWTTAQQICHGIQATLASILSPEEERFITTNIRKMPEYRTSALYWLGGKIDKKMGFHWIDGSPVEYLGWLPGEIPMEGLRTTNESLKCLGVQWTAAPTPLLPSGLYWKSQRCNLAGGYVCKKMNQSPGEGLNFNKTLNGTEGTITSPNYPENYFNNLDVYIKIVGPKRTRLVVKFERMEIENQIECLYDFVELYSVDTSGRKIGDAVKWCGSHEIDMHHFTFVSETREAVVKFHSDYSITGNGFSLTWHAVDLSFCPDQILTAKEGFVISPNYPNFLLSHLNCTMIIKAPQGQYVWFEFLSLDFGANYESNENPETLLELQLGTNRKTFRPFFNPYLLTDGSFLSYGKSLTMRLRTGKKPKGAGFKAHYKLITSVKEERNIFLNNDTFGTLLHLNYPEEPALQVDYIQHFIAPAGSIISLELYHISFGCDDASAHVEIYDNYSDANGTVWKLCRDYSENRMENPVDRIEITSFFNTVHLRQVGGPVAVNGTLRVLPDAEFKEKLLRFKNEVETCSPNPCLYGGKCIRKRGRKFCECVGHFTGAFCALTKCELDPCVFGSCELTPSSYKCHCKPGYTGPTCEQKRRPCEGNPCEGRGLCVERGDGFLCRCHAWWEGQRCERRMLHIPYKPLSERMLHEPFWLGLMTVFVVMAVIGLVWCAKRHFPEKIEKLLAEESERTRSTISSLRSASVREQLAAASAAAAAVSASGNASVTVTPSPGAGAPRSFFGRLGSPSPKKKRNNSTPTKKNAAEKKQILQQLVSPSAKHISRKVSLGELMQMSDRKTNDEDYQLKVKETKFIEPESVQSALNDPKLEKKVTFARLLNKVFAEMSSGSDMEMGIMQNNRLGCVFVRPSSTPPSPCLDARSPNSTSSNQGSDSFSSDLAIPSALSSSISDLLVRRHNSVRLNTSRKPTSADSILAMFRNFSSSSAGVNLPSSLIVSPSTTPTGSSPQDDIVGDDESSTSSVHTPVSFCSSVAPESPLHLPSQSTIEVPVLDTISAHKSSSLSGSSSLHPPTILLEIPSTINKCLSPIREMPTPLPSPMPSPAMSPRMRRNVVTPTVDDNCSISDDRISIEIPNISISSEADDDDMQCTSDIAIDPQAEDGLILEEVAAMHHNNVYKTKIRPPPLGQTSLENHVPPLVIPTLIIETPSPTYSQSPCLSFPGSPPPHKPKQDNTCFQFPPICKQRKMFKDFDKPTSLDLPSGPPMITITCNMSEAESDVETMSPAIKQNTHLSAATSGMTYLSPFSMGGREHTTSESNLSSSGYSSMASPGSSRCGSSNPLCPSEMEDQGPPGCGSRRPSPILKSKVNSSEGGTSSDKVEDQQQRGRSDSETLSDDPLIESNDEGIGTDHLDEKIEEGEVKSAKELEVFLNENEIVDDVISKPKILEDCLLQTSIGKNLLQLPSIVVQSEEKHLSPMSSRSESPLSDRTSISRFSPQFYGKTKDNLPFTDSDGLYDFPSSASDKTITTQHRKIGRKRDKKSIRSCKTPSPTKNLPNYHLDIPTKEIYKVPPPRKVSPKRRIARSQVVSSSSSSDSVTSGREIKMSSSSPSPDTIKWSSPVEWNDIKVAKAYDFDLDEPTEDATHIMLSRSEDIPRSKKLSKLRAISHQVRFLRRLETSLRRKDRGHSPSDSLESNGEDSPRATSPLLQRSKNPQVEIRKSNSIGKLSSSTSSQPNRNRSRSKYRRDEMLLTQQETGWKKVVITSSGHSD